jgi:predicted phosphodiesterase
MRRLALISDIHGNALALEAVLADIARRRVDEIVCLGDIAAGGPQPRDALERLRALGCAVVRGNADVWLLGLLPAGEEDEEARRLRTIVEWGRRQLSDAVKRRQGESFGLGRQLIGCEAQSDLVLARAREHLS